ncbi:MAG: hypothetical protein MUQ65_15915 [Armatimonadetes bacterium]|nr:hypothetical protein [Armatimonadota bacterium]
MNDVRSRSRQYWIVIVVSGLVGQLYGIFCLRVLLARLGGASMSEALRAEFPFRRPTDWVFVVVAASALVGSVYSVFIRRGADGHGTAPGAVIWRRQRLLPVIVALLALVCAAAYLASMLAGGGGTEGLGWMYFLLPGLLVAGALLLYVRKPTPEYLHALETGDHSRLQDERAQRVGGAAAAITLSIFVPILFFGGVLYEVLFRGEWPIRTGLEVVIILLVWSLASWHWNRAL